MRPHHTSDMFIRTVGRLLVLPIVLAGLLSIGAVPAQAAGEQISVGEVKTVGCLDGQYTFALVVAGQDGAGGYRVHTTVTVERKVYMNEDATSPASGYDTWGLFDDSFNYGSVSNPGTWPIPAGHQMQVRISLERPKGTVLSSWTMVAESCDSPTRLYNGPTSADLDEDFLVAPTDKCPHLKSFRANGCPLRDRTLTLNDKYGPRRVVGKLYSPGYPLLYAGRTVKIWKKRTGPDLKVATRTTSSLGTFKARVGKGRYYATSKGVIVASAGQVTADTSTTVRVH
jgi:hypothetical protein